MAKWGPRPRTTQGKQIRKIAKAKRAISERFWDLQEYNADQAASIGWDTVQRLWKKQGQRRLLEATDYLQLYFGSGRYHPYGRSYGNPLIYDVDPPSQNLVQALTDTIVAMLFREQVRPFYLTTKGDGQLREKAQAMSRVNEAIFREVGVWDALGLDTLFDGHIYDGGVTQWYPDYANNDVCADRTPPWEMMTLELEGKRPRQFFRRALVPRDKLTSFYSGDDDALDAIERCGAASYQDVGLESWDDDLADMVEVCMLWHLPSMRVDRSRPEAFGVDEDGDAVPYREWGHDGVHLVCCEHGLLQLDAVPYAYPPFAFFLPMRKPNEFWSRSVPESIYAEQTTLIRMNARLEEILHLWARPLLYVWSQARLNPNKVTNALASIIEGNVPANQAIQTIAMNAVPNEYFQRIRDIIDGAKEKLGISEQSMRANRQPGIEHAPAYQHLQDLENIRQTPRFRAWQEWHVQGGRRVTDAVRMLAKRNPDYSVIWGESKDLREYKWADIDLPDNKFRITTWGTNLLPQTPSAKIARLAEIVRSGAFTPEQVKLLTTTFMEFPDIEAALGDVDAQERNIENKLEALRRGAKFVDAMPHQYMNLALAKLKVVDKLNALEADGFDESKLELLRQFYFAVDQLEKRQAQGAAAAGAGGFDPLAPPPPEGGEPAAEPALPPGGAPPAELSPAPQEVAA
jgi:hypothetical protein